MNAILKYSTILAGIWLISSCGPTSTSERYTIQQGAFRASLIETGELQAVVAKHIVMPFLGWKYGYRNKITGMLEHGAEVEEGDSVISLDLASVMKFLVEHENNLEMEKAVMNKLIVEHSNKAQELESQQSQQQANYNLEKLEMEKSQFDSERNKQIQELEFQKAEINLAKTRKSIEYNEQTARIGRKIQEIKIRQMEIDIENAKHALTRLVLRSPNSGILQIEYNRSTRQLFKIGDESYPNRSLASIPDLRRMKVLSTINEADIGKIQTGRRAVVRLDAFPDQEFEGAISYIGKLSYKKDRESNIKVFDIEVLLDESDSKVLKPGMTVSCEIIYAEYQDALFVSNDCVSKENGQFFLYKKVKGDVIKVPVDIGPRNNSHTLVHGELEKGEQVLSMDLLSELISTGTKPLIP